MSCSSGGQNKTQLLVQLKSKWIGWLWLLSSYGNALFSFYIIVPSSSHWQQWKITPQKYKKFLSHQKVKLTLYCSQMLSLSAFSIIWELHAYISVTCWKFCCAFCVLFVHVSFSFITQNLIFWITSHYHHQCHFVLLDKCTCDNLVVLKQEMFGKNDILSVLFCVRVHECDDETQYSPTLFLCVCLLLLDSVD